MVTKALLVVWLSPAVGVRMYVGTFTEELNWVDGTPGPGLRSYELGEDGELSEPIDYEAGTSNPAWLLTTETTMYAAGETIVALNRSDFEILSIADAGVGSAVHLSEYDNYLLAAHYGGGAVTVYALDPLTLVQTIIFDDVQGTGRQSSAHPHAIYASGDDVYVPDLGADKIRRFVWNTTVLEQSEDVEVAAGSGPRHLAFHSSGEWVFALFELSNEIASYSVNFDGSLSYASSASTLVDQPSDNQTAGAIYVSGTYVLASNRGDHNSVVVFEANLTTGALAFVSDTDTEGLTPRDFLLTEDGLLLVANQDSDTIVSFYFSEEDGLLSRTPANVTVVGSPACLTL
ncbi:hypothetical protein CTAYLR_004952 [Chrysophaeum taylorii]|uniref:6-phosphogluconolactonase n=1 Tax=Chrysophaeum taylorii TaxID=2483200 RepID=A0AAD7UPQ4_9STRA|nr:hypothetical protein CTAYLR_004952 [Chrysophaeum taylorii]